jgi:hypothetical protein
VHLLKKLNSGFFHNLILSLLLCFAEGSLEPAYAADPDPKFDLRLTNRNYISSNEGYFDIILKHTNPQQSNFLYTRGRYVIALDTSFVSEHLRYVYSKDTSTFGNVRIPPEYVGDLTKVNDLLKLSFGQTIPAGSEPLISSVSGTLVARIKFYNPDLYSNSCLTEEQFLWKTSIPGDFTKLYSRKDGMSVLINNNLSNFSTSDLCIGTLCCLSAPLHPPIRISPQNNSTGLSAPVELIWKKGFPVNYSANVQIASDSGFNYLVYEESITAPDGTEDVNLTLNSVVAPGIYYWRVKQGGIPPQGAYNEPWRFKIETPVISLNLTAIPEGVVKSSSSFDYKIKVYLRNSSPPFQIVDSSFITNHDSTFENVSKFENAPTGKYYIVIKTPNTLETWSKLGGDSLFKRSEPNVYDFSIDSSQAYNCNLTHVEDKYCLFSGDVNQDSFIDVKDLLLIYNNIVEFESGTLNADLTWDGNIDLNDLIIGYNNSFGFICTKSPLTNPIMTANLNIMMR